LDDHRRFSAFSWGRRLLRFLANQRLIGNLRRGLVLGDSKKLLGRLGDMFFGKVHTRIEAKGVVKRVLCTVAITTPVKQHPLVDQRLGPASLAQALRGGLSTLARVDDSELAQSLLISRMSVFVVEADGPVQPLFEGLLSLFGGTLGGVGVSRGMSRGCLSHRWQRKAHAHEEGEQRAGADGSLGKNHGPTLPGRMGGSNTFSRGALPAKEVGAVASGVQTPLTLERDGMHTRYSG
jgi:hypothetical protein